MNDITSLISGVGFPIAVAVYLLIYMRKSLDSLKDVIAKNSEIIAKLYEKLNCKDN